MIYLSGCTSPSYEQALIDMGVGLLIQPGTYAPIRTRPFARWAADNGCWSPTWEPLKWHRFVERVVPEGGERCLFFLVPDVPMENEGTMERWRQFRPLSPDGVFPIAFAIQDGATDTSVPWDEFDVAFLAGTTEWKCGRPAFDIACRARERGKWIHMGRVNSWDRLDWASTIGCDSSDGTFMKHGKPEDMVARMKVWLDNNNPRLFQKQAEVSA